MKGMRYLQAWAGGLLLMAGVFALFFWYALAEQSHKAADHLYGLDATVTTISDALLVDSLREGGDAERSGLRVGDRIEEVDHHEARSRGEIDRALVAHHHVRLHVRRTGRTLDIDVATHRT